MAKYEKTKFCKYTISKRKKNHCPGGSLINIWTFARQRLNVVKSGDNLSPVFFFFFFFWSFHKLCWKCDYNHVVSNVPIWAALFGFRGIYVCHCWEDLCPTFLPSSAWMDSLSPHWDLTMLWLWRVYSVCRCEESFNRSSGEERERIHWVYM